MRCRRLTALPLLMLLLPVSAACSGSPDPSSMTGVPTSWLRDTDRGWPDSDGYGSAIPVYVEGGDCLLGDHPPRVLGREADFTNAGWGGLGTDPEAHDSYRYGCEIYRDGGYSGSVQLLRVPDAAAADQVMSDFAATTSTPVQDNTVTTVTTGHLRVLVLRRWIPSNPQGSYTAQVEDADHLAIVTLEINSLDRDDFDGYSDREAADALISFMAT